MSHKNVFLLIYFFMLVKFNFADNNCIQSPTPSNGQIVSVPSNVFFSWNFIPNQDNDVSYILRVMSIGISEDIPLNLDNCSGCQSHINIENPYQSDLVSLFYNLNNECRKYVWDVRVVKNNAAQTTPDGQTIPASQNILCYSDVFYFTSQCLEPSNTSSSQLQYMSFSDVLNAYVYGVKINQSISFKYESLYNDETINCKVYDLHKNVVHAEGFQLVKGLNYLSVDSDNFETGNVYVLEIENSKNQFKSLKFRIVP